MRRQTETQKAMLEHLEGCVKTVREIVENSGIEWRALRERSGSEELVLDYYANRNYGADDARKYFTENYSDQDWRWIDRRVRQFINNPEEFYRRGFDKE